MQIILDIFKIKYGEGSVEKGKINRHEEWTTTLSEALKHVRNVLEKISDRRRKPFVFVCISEGATTLSIQSEWIRPIEDEVRRVGGVMFTILNTGLGLGAINDDEFKKRMEVIHEVLHETRTPKIITNNVIRRRRRSGGGEISELVFDNEVFDYYFSLMLYTLAIATIGDPQGADLENLFSPGSIHAVTTPVVIRSYDEFRKESESGNVSFMFMGDLGSGTPAPCLIEVQERVNGSVIVGYSADRVKSITDAFKTKMPAVHYSSYSIKPVREERSILNRISSIASLPVVEERSSRRGWSGEPAIVFFTARITGEEAVQAIIKAREFFKKLSHGKT